MSNITYDGTINPDRPDLPFAQASQFNPMWSGTINPDRPDLPFAQTMTGAVNRHMTKSTTGDYTIYWKNGGQTNLTLSNEAANQHRVNGHTVVLNNAKSSSIDIVKLSSGISKSQIEQIFIDYYGDDISLLHSHASELGAAMQRAKTHRDEIEARINKAHLQHTDIHTKLTNLGKSVSDVSGALETHKLTPHVNIGNPFDISSILPYILIGGVALLALSGRKKR